MYSDIAELLLLQWINSKKNHNKNEKGAHYAIGISNQQFSTLFLTLLPILVIYKFVELLNILI